MMLEETLYGTPSPDSPRYRAMLRQCRRIRPDGGCPCPEWFCRQQAGRPPRVLCCGSRKWHDWLTILKALRKLPEGTLVIHGGCQGADEAAGSCAETCGFDVKVFPAEWKKYGKSAGPIRNQQMLDEGKPDVVFAFTDDLENSRGTKNMVYLATKANVPVVLFDGSEARDD